MGWAVEWEGGVVGESTGTERKQVLLNMLNESLCYDRNLPKNKAISSEDVVCCLVASVSEGRICSDNFYVLPH